MASNTENLNLLMKNPSTDGADTFNIQTMLNENWQKIDNNAGTVAQTLANILKPTTPPIIGLPPSTTPDGMFQALGNTGELHVWRKTIVTPAGTTITYPVSTNPNAYQEGSDAKEAWYVLGEKTNTEIPFQGTNQYQTYYYGDASTVSVSDNGVVSISKGSFVDLDRYSTSKTDALKGKYIQGYPVGYPATSVYYIPDDAKFLTGNGRLFCDKAQLLTGYAAIPAGTTIEYLGKLGDKAREQVVSYVGTGTYGVNNKNKLTFSGKPRFVMVPGAPFGYAYIPNGYFYYAMASDYITLEDLNCDWNDDTNTMTWYHPSYPYRQYNESGKKYTFVAIY